MPKYGPLQPYDWPQDTLRIPNGQGLMPRVAFTNGYLARREFAIYSAPELTITPRQPSRVIIPIEADADFWCSQIVCAARIPVTYANSGLPASRMLITDIRTGYQIGYPEIRVNQFPAFNFAGVPDDFIQPYCFTRNGGIELVIDHDFGLISTAGLRLFVSFIGWKEYVYASQ